MSFPRTLTHKCYVLYRRGSREKGKIQLRFKETEAERLRHKRLLRDRRTRSVAFCDERKRAEGRGQNGGLAQGGNRQCGALQDMLTMKQKTGYSGTCLHPATLDSSKPAWTKNQKNAISRGDERVCTFKDQHPKNGRYQQKEEGYSGSCCSKPKGQ